MSSRLSGEIGGWRVSFVALIISFGLAAWSPIYAQVVGATLSGSLNDPSGAVIPNAHVVITNVGTGVSRDVTTNDAGYYTAPNLLPGSYSVTVTAQGFKTEVRSGITLTVGAEQVLNIGLQVGQTSQTVEVTGEAPTVELASSTLGNLVNSTTVAELPLNGRDWTQLATLEAGVNTLQTQPGAGFTSSRAVRGFGNEYTISGTRPQQNNYRWDGISISNYAGGSPGGVLGSTLGADAVGEFTVLTSNSDAEYGRTSGGIINAITRSGSNQFHGDVFEFLRNADLDSKGLFDGLTKPPFRRNQFGASAGGPIKKDKLFFFANYEGLRQNLGVTNVNIVPSANAEKGIVSTAGAPVASCPAGTTLFVPGTSNVCVNNLVIPYFATYPLPNAGLIGAGDVGHYDVITSQGGTENFGAARTDWKMSANDSLSGTYQIDRDLLSQPTVLDEALNGNTSSRQLATIEETHVFSPTLLNTFRVGWNHDRVIQNYPISALVPAAGSGSLGVIPGANAPTINISGLASFQAYKGLNPNDEGFDSYQLYDDVFLTKGKHTFKFGFYGEYYHHNANGAGQITGGVFTFGGLTQFLTNVPTSLQEPGEGGTVLFRQKIFGAYMSDDWHIRSNLTLNLGLRYEPVGDLHEANNQLSNLRNITDAAPTLGAPMIQNPTLRNFEPRVGFAWDPFHDGKTSVRGAFGMFDILPLSSEFFAPELSSSPYHASPVATSLPAGSFPTILLTDFNLPVTGTALRYTSAQYDPHRNYVMIWNLNVQRALTPSTTLTVGFVGNHGVHMLYQTQDGNWVLPVSTSNGQFLWPTPIGSGTQVNPGKGLINVQSWGGSAVYDALVATVTKKFSHGFEALGSYTWGKNIDEGSGTTIGSEYTNSLPAPFWFCISCDRGLSDFNIAQNLTISYVWDIQTPKDWGSISQHVLGGWELGGIFSAHTGVPVSAIFGGDPLGTKGGVTPTDLPDRVTGSGCSSLVNPGSIAYVKVQCFTLPIATPAIASMCVPFKGITGTCENLFGNAGRNIIIGPGFWDLDFSLLKNNYIPRISESFNVQFRAELFNILNHQNLQTPVDNDTFFSASGVPTAGAGTVDTLVGTARQLQFALKVIF